MKKICLVLILLGWGIGAFGSEKELNNPGSDNNILNKEMLLREEIMQNLPKLIVSGMVFSTSISQLIYNNPCCSYVQVLYWLNGAVDLGTFILIMTYFGLYVTDGQVVEKKR